MRHQVPEVEQEGVQEREEAGEERKRLLTDAAKQTDVWESVVVGSQVLDTHWKARVLRICREKMRPDSSGDRLQAELERQKMEIAKEHSGEADAAANSEAPKVEDATAFDSETHWGDERGRSGTRNGVPETRGGAFDRTESGGWQGQQLGNPGATTPESVQSFRPGTV